jgi:hypothetical protein
LFRSFVGAGVFRGLLIFKDVKKVKYYLEIRYYCCPLNVGRDGTLRIRSVHYISTSIVVCLSLLWSIVT